MRLVQLRAGNKQDECGRDEQCEPERDRLCRRAIGLCHLAITSSSCALHVHRHATVGPHYTGNTPSGSKR